MMSAFTNLKISISGIRGLAPEDLTPAAVYALCRAYAENLAGDSVLVSKDSRPSGRLLKPAVFQALTDAGKKILDADLIPISTTQIAVRALQAGAGIDITASHNPIEYNGLKFLNNEGQFIDQQLLDKIVLSAEKYVDGYRPAGLVIAAEDVNESTIEAHLELLKKIIQSGRQLIVAVDAVNGAGSFIVPRLLELMGCEVIKIANDPDQPFPLLPEPTPANLVWTQEQLQGKKFDLCVVVDPDADRLTLIDERGNLLSEEYTLPIIAATFVARGLSGTMVVNQSTSQMIDEVVKDSAIKIIRSAVGEFNVVLTMKKYQAIFGGEGNGGIVDPQINLGRDSLTGIVQVINRLRQNGKKMSELVAELSKFVMIKQKIDARSITDVPKFYQQVRELFPDAQVDLTDGLRLFWPTEKKWLHLRPSNTETIIRLIAEAKTQGEIDMFVRQIKKLIDDGKFLV